MAPQDRQPLPWRKPSGLRLGWDERTPNGLAPTDAVAVLTHDARFDEPAIVEALRRGCRYVGAIGSRRTANPAAVPTAKV